MAQRESPRAVGWPTEQNEYRTARPVEAVYRRMVELLSAIGGKVDGVNLGKRVRRHSRKAFWQRWHSPKGRKAALLRMGVKGRLLRLAHSSAGAWRMAGHAVMNTALSLRQLRKYGLDVPWAFAAST